MSPVFRGGARIRHGEAPEGLYGTLGCVVRDRATHARCILTAAHVIGLYGYAEPGDAVVAMDPASGAWLKIAEFLRSVPFRDADGVLQQCDAAIARIVDDALVGDEVEDFGTPGLPAGAIYTGMGLSFRGARSGTVRGAVLHSTGNVVPLVYERGSNRYFSLKFRDQMLYGRQSGTAWRSASDGGDSGALVMAESSQPVGLHIARTPDDFEIAASVCTPIQTVLDALQVDLATATATAAAPAGAAAPVPAGTGPTADRDELGRRSFGQFDQSVRSLLEPHGMFEGANWRLSERGVIVEGSLPRTAGALVTVPRIWGRFGGPITDSATRLRVPVELILATICTESGGVPTAVREERGWVDDLSTPGRVSAGLMQTLLSNARNALPGQAVSRQSLCDDPAQSIEAGTFCIRQRFTRTLFDPPLVACAYNAGSLYRSLDNRWHLAQTGNHADRFVEFFNDSMAFFALLPGELPPLAPSFSRLFAGDAP